MFRPTSGATSLININFVESFRQRSNLEGNVPFMSLFGNETNGSGSQTLFTDDATDVNIKLVNNVERIANWGTRGVSSPIGLGSRIMNGETATSTTRAFPIIKDFQKITSEDTSFKTPIGSGLPIQTKKQVLLELAETGAYNSTIGHVWRHEYMASEAILTGKATVDTMGNQLDFKRHVDNTITLAYAWSDKTNSKPLLNMDTAAVRVHKNGKARPDFCGMSVDMYDDMINHPDIQKIADIRGFDIAFFGDNLNSLPFDGKYARAIKGGWMPRAILTTASGYRITIFTTIGSYTDTNGVMQNYMPASTFFVSSMGARFDRYFGPDDKMDDEAMLNTMRYAAEVYGVENRVVAIVSRESGEIFDARMLKFFIFKDPRGNFLEIESQSAPIYAPVQANAVCVCKEP